MTPTPAASPSYAMPTPAPLEAVRHPPIVRRPVLTGAALSALLAAWALDGGPFGLGFFLTVLATALVLAVGSGREGWQSAKRHRWVLAAAVGLSFFVVIRDSDLLVALDVLAVVWLLALAVRGWNGDDPLEDASLGEVLLAPATSGAASAGVGFAVILEALRGTRLSSVAPALLLPALKVSAVALPVIGAVTLLLASGDAAFGATLLGVVEGLVELPVERFARFAVVALLAFFGTAGG